MTSPHWPHPERSMPQRNLAWLEDEWLTIEDDRSYRVKNLDALIELVFKHNLLTFTPKSRPCKWLGEAAFRKDCELSVTKTDTLERLCVKKGRGKRYVLCINVWGASERRLAGLPELPEDQEHLRIDTLLSLREVLRRSSVGVRPTPGSLGQAILRRMYAGRDVWRLAEYPWGILYTHMIGGRADLLQPDKWFPVCWELDMASAYANAIREVPAGTPGWGRGEPRRIVTGFYRCSVVAPSTSVYAIGPLPIRRGKGERVYVAYPISGRWDGWYWWEEIMAARSAGYSVTIHEGFTWRGMSKGFSPWADEMIRLRTEAPEPLGDLFKLATVAGIGRFGMDTLERTISGRWRKGDTVRFGPNDEESYLHEERKRTCEQLIHIYSYVMSMVRVGLYLRAVLEGPSLIATNYDAVFTAKEPRNEAWKVKQLTNARFRYKRWVESDQKIVTPGL